MELSVGCNKTLDVAQLGAAFKVNFFELSVDNTLCPYRLFLLKGVKFYDRNFLGHIINQKSKEILHDFLDNYLISGAKKLFIPELKNKIKIDGIVLGLKEAPKTQHIWLHKTITKNQFSKIEKLMANNIENDALFSFSLEQYLVGQISMHILGLKRTFNTFISFEAKKIITLRTEYDKNYVIPFLENLKDISEIDSLEYAPVPYKGHWCHKCNLKKQCKYYD